MFDEQRKVFDRPPQSYWMASTPRSNYPVLSESIQAEIAIVGGGMSGVTCGYLLAKEGYRVVLLEADRILQGATGHTTAKITSQHGLIYHQTKAKMGEELARQYAHANEFAIRFIERTAQELSIDCDFMEQSAYVFTQQDPYIEQIEDEARTVGDFGIKADYLREIPLDLPIKAAVRYEGQAQFHPRKYLLGLAQAFLDLGGRIYEQSRVVELDEQSNYVLSTSENYRVTAERVIIASHYPFYNKMGFYYTRLYSERSYALGVRTREKYPGGMYISAEEPTRSLRSQRTEEGELIILSGEHHKTGQGKDTIQHYQALMAFAHEHYTVEDIPYRWSTQDCTTMDDIPYIGRFTAKTPNLYIATGYRKWGMTNSTVSGILIKDLIVHGESPWQEVYNPSRVHLEASVKNFVVENLNVAKELLEGKLSPVPEEVDIQPGEGKVIHANGQRTGAYRDEQGVLHLVNTTCTHMGCELNWNSAEKSWDCPCHGSRFTYEGEIIEGPAVLPIKSSQDINTLKRVLKDEY